MESNPVAPVVPPSTRADSRPAQQPFKYPLERPFVEPDWTRLPGYQSVTREEWEKFRAAAPKGPSTLP